MRRQTGLGITAVFVTAWLIAVSLSFFDIQWMNPSHGPASLLGYCALVCLAPGIAGGFFAKRNFCLLAAASPLLPWLFLALIMLAFGGNPLRLVGEFGLWIISSSATMALGAATGQRLAQIYGSETMDGATWQQAP